MVVAWVIPKSGEESKCTEATLRMFCEGRLAHYKIPKHFIMVDALPLTGNGKVRKVDMVYICLLFFFFVYF